MYIPKLLCTQHPDATVKITTQQEVDEALQGYAMYGCDEIMSDYEGKLTPYAQPKDIVLRSYELEIPIGEKFFVTPRIPNPSLEDFDRVDLSIEAGLIANYYSYKTMNVQAVRWFILPMVEDSNVVRFVQRLIIMKEKVISEEVNAKMLPVQLIPLIEETHKHMVIHDYVSTIVSVLNEFDAQIDILRVFLGKSDAAVRSGHIASSLSLVYALNELEKLAKEYDIEIKPIIGMGVPPFRGALNNPELVEYEVQRYRGFSTATIQSAIRYDIPYRDYIIVKNTILANVDTKPKPMPLSSDVIGIIDQATRLYRRLVSKYCDIIQKIANNVPGTRERISWKSYGRILPLQNEALSVPRAIVYTSAWYATGIPPTYLDAEFVIEMYKQDKLDEILKLVPYLDKEWLYDSKFYVRDIAIERLNEDIVKKVDKALDIMGIKPEPIDVYRSLLMLNPIELHITALGKIRGFLG
ncbi:MAG: phosphoenolpyruvate carboxylase [Ignisphaera sp.]